MPGSTATQLPVEADADRVDKALSAAHDAVERVVWALKGLDDYIGGEPDAPRVELEHLGALAMIRDDLRIRIDDLHAFLERLDQGIGAAAAVRSEQRSRRAS